MDTLHFSIISGRDKELLSSAAVYATLGISNYIFVSNNPEDLDYWIQYIKSETGVNITPCLLHENAYMPVAHYFVSHLDTFKDKKINHVNLLQCEITENLDLASLFSKLFYRVDDCQVSNLNMNLISHISGKVRDEIIILNNIYNEIVDAKLNLFIGQSSFTPQINYSNISGNEFSALMLKEIKRKSFNFNSIDCSGYSYVDNYLKNIRSYLQNLFLAIPATSMDIIGKTSSNKYIQDGFPLIFKILSVIHFYSAKLQEKKKNYNISFLHYIRSVECFIDGYLIIKGTGSFNSYDEYITDGIPKKGAGFKFNKAGNFDLLISQPCYSKIKNLIEIRNKFFLTHGDMRVCDHIVNDFGINITNLFKFIELQNHHINFKWEYALNQIETNMNINIGDFIYSALVEKYSIKSLS